MSVCTQQGCLRVTKLTYYHHLLLHVLKFNYNQGISYYAFILPILFSITSLGKNILVPIFGNPTLSMLRITGIVEDSDLVLRGLPQ